MRATFAAIAIFATVSTPVLAAPTPSEILDAYHAAVGGKAWDGKTALSLEYAYSGQGMTGKTGTIIDLVTGRFVDRFAIGPATGANGFDGAHGWAKDQSGTVTAQDGGETLPLAYNEAYRGANLWWRPAFGGAAITLEGQKSDGGATYDVLSIAPKGGKAFEAWFDTKSHLLARTFEQQGSSPVTTYYFDYRPFDGAGIATHQRITTGDPKYDQTQTLTSAKFLAARDAAVFAPPKNAVADFAIGAGAHETTFPFALINNHIYASVKVNGKGPFTFIFDTGGSNLVTPTLVKALALKVEGHIEARGAGSGTMDAGFTKIEKLELGDASLKDQLFMSIPLDSMSNVEGFDQVGMVGFETFRRFVTRIDYGKKTITLIDPKSFDAKDAGAAIPLTFDGNVPEIVASYGGVSGKFQLDTGARTSLTLTAPFVAKNGLRKPELKGVEAVTGWGIGGPTRSFVTRGSPLAFGAITVPSPVTQLSTDKGGAMAEADLAGNIGAGILKRFAITLDYGHNTLYVKPAGGAIPDVDTFDRAGLWINKGANGFEIVDVTKGTPAEEAGLKAGDVIVRVDAEAATAIGLADLRYRLRNQKAGTTVTFTVKRDGHPKDFQVKLRDLI